ncbi:nuclear transport factor 2 family protein [Aliidiomarina indica]|uniref:nuclear transport factor 2 family protein n=1 Tax=Aliidiomarina indica TaxID=2749147 RepID=UPI00188FD98A|nr:nuclear transport factor 2 family protein [Aliidiomarina indica]
MAKIKTKERRDLLEKFKAFYDDLSLDSLKNLSDIYHDDVSFVDPVTQVNGLDDLKSYLNHGLANVSSCHFAIYEEMVNQKQAFVVWQMRLHHEKLAGGLEIVVPGTSHLVFSEDSHSIRHQVDYYDLGAMVYEHVPVLGWILGKVRQRMVDFE